MRMDSEPLTGILYKGKLGYKPRVNALSETRHVEGKGLGEAIRVMLF